MCGGVLCTYISPKVVCDSGVKNRGWGWKSEQKETPSGQKETPSGQFVRKVAKCSRIWQKKIHHEKILLAHSERSLQPSFGEGNAWSTMDQSGGLTSKALLAAKCILSC